ncbi:hypothetical protein [Streptomyces sp. NPDC048521]|uniref:hypothetical protein n=1 Tax=Streptomyces sp. NPDC048521 TaxID=3365566 RepID=UPI0037133A5B
MRGKGGELGVCAGLLAALFALVLWGAPAATAGGPTSVLVASPESGQARALYFSDKDYDRLRGLLGPENTGSRSTPPEADLADARQINVTWLVHDISPWRVDRVFTADSRPRDVWIHTATQVPASLNGYWHRAEHPGELRSLLGRLGVMGRVPSSGTGYTGIFPAPWQSGTPSAAAEAPAAGRARADGSGAEDSGVGTGWWWAVPGAAVGAVLTLALGPGGVLIRRAAARRSAGPPREEPRQELTDL